MERKIALCVSQWSADSTLYAWSYAKQYFLRVCVHRLRLSNAKDSALDLPNIYYKICHCLLLGLFLLKSVIYAYAYQLSRLCHILRCLAPFLAPFWALSWARIILSSVGIGAVLGYSGISSRTASQSQA